MAKHDFNTIYSIFQCYLQGEVDLGSLSLSPRGEVGDLKILKSNSTHYFTYHVHFSRSKYHFYTTYTVFCIFPQGEVDFGSLSLSYRGEVGDSKM